MQANPAKRLLLHLAGTVFTPCIKLVWPDINLTIPVPFPQTAHDELQSVISQNNLFASHTSSWRSSTYDAISDRDKSYNERPLKSILSHRAKLGYSRGAHSDTMGIGVEEGFSFGFEFWEHGRIGRDLL